MKIIAQIFLLLLLAGCAAKCKKATFWDGGYQEFKVNDHEYILTFEESWFSKLIAPSTPAEIDRIIALRAAELTLQNGYTHFDFRRGNSSKVVHIYCYSKEDTETAIDALAFTEKFSNPPSKEQIVEIATQGNI
jgi:hypothetical protein